MWWAAFVPAETPKPISEQLAKWFNQVTASEEAKKFLNRFLERSVHRDCRRSAGETAKEDKNWAEYIKIAKIEPQG